MENLHDLAALVEARLHTVRTRFQDTSAAGRRRWPSIRAAVDAETIAQLKALGARFRRTRRRGGGFSMSLAGVRGGDAGTVTGALSSWRFSARRLAELESSLGKA